MSINLRKDRYSPDVLPALEEIRWRNVLRYKAFIQGPYKDMFNMIPEGGYCFGYKDNELRCFHYDGEGLGNYAVNESSDTLAYLFVGCLADDQLPRYINSKNKKVQQAVRDRFQGTARPPIPFRQDIIDLYYKYEMIYGRFQKVIGYVDQVIKGHLQALTRRIPGRFRDYKHILALNINGRAYLQRGEIYLPPETMLWSFTPEDINAEDTVDADHQFKHQIAIQKTSGGTHDKTT